MHACTVRAMRKMRYIFFILISLLELIRLPSNPAGLAYDSISDVVFVAQSHPKVNKILAVDVTTGAVVRTIGRGLNYPYDVALDFFGHLLVADYANKRIAVFIASDGTPVTSFRTPFKPHSVFVAKNGGVVIGGADGLIIMWSS